MQWEFSMVIHQDDRRRHLIQHFNDVVFGFIEGDLKALQQIPRHAASNCAIPLTLAVFSAINHVGGLLVDPVGNRKFPEYDRSLKEFCNRYMRHRSPLYSDDTFLEFLIFIFRNAMSHHYIPSVAIIERSGEDSGLIERNIDGVPKLNSDRLAKDFLVSSRLMYDELKDPQVDIEAIDKRLANTQIASRIGFDKINKIRSTREQVCP
jgi:hypothetical protein